MTGKRKGAEQRYNLKMMRKFTADADPLNLGILPVRPAYEPKVKAGFTKVRNVFPDTLDELIERLGVHGEAAGIDVLWSAVSRWLMNEASSADLTNIPAVANLAVMLCRAHDRKRLGFPCYASNRVTLVLDDLCEANRQETLRVAAETIADCQRAGMLVVTLNRLKCTYQMIVAVTHYQAEALALNSKDTAACPL